MAQGSLSAFAAREALRKAKAKHSTSEEYYDDSSRSASHRSDVSTVLSSSEFQQRRKESRGRLDTTSVEHSTQSSSSALLRSLLPLSTGSEERGNSPNQLVDDFHRRGWTRGNALGSARPSQSRPESYYSGYTMVDVSSHRPSRDTEQQPMISSIKILPTIAFSSFVRSANNYKDECCDAVSVTLDNCEVSKKKIALRYILD